MLPYEKEGVATAILAVREFQRASLTAKLGSDWTEARIGMYFTGVEAHDNNLAPPDETLVVDDVSDYVTFGLKDANSYFLPGESGSVFLGVRSTASISKVSAPGLGAGWFADSNEKCSAIGYAGTSLADGGIVANGPLLFPDAQASTGFNGFYCVKFTVNNRGAANQSVAISVARSGQISGTDYGKAALYQAINNSSFGAARNVIWNTGSIARALPDAAWVRIPFYNARIRIQEIMAVKISP